MTASDLGVKLQSHQAWLGNRFGGGQRADFRGADLRGVNFEAADLRYADFRAANCQGVNFSKSDCRGADFRGANLAGARCVGTKLQNARLDGADLSGIDLRSAEMEFAQAAGADAGRKYSLDEVRQQAAELRQEKPKQRDVEHGR